MRSLLAAAPLLLVSSTAAQAAPTSQPTSQPTSRPTSQPASRPSSQPAARPTVAMTGKFDWIKLVSGEWLKGAIKGLRDGKLTFGSDKLKNQVLDWSDIEQVRAPHVHTYVLDDGRVLVGRATIDKTAVTVRGKKGEQRVARGKLIRLVPGEPSELNWWAIKLTLGLSFNAGNTNQVTFTTGLKLRREDAFTRGLFSYDGSYGRAMGAENQNRHVGNLQFDIFVLPRLYITAAAAQLTHDSFQNTDLRLLALAGLGYRPIKTKHVQWDLGALGGYQYFLFGSVQPGPKNPQHEGAIVLNTHVRFDINPSAHIDLDWTTALIPSNIGLTAHQGVSEVDVNLHDAFMLNVKLTYRRLEQPRQRADGTTPEKNDLQLIVGLTLNLGYD